jgi:23S rRNA (cytosine1962-C5)-methyltransferase
MELKKVILSSGKDLSLKRFHPWVFSGAIKKIKNSLGKETEVADGELVEVFSNKDEFLGMGHFQNGSISVRIISFEQRIPDQEFWNQKIGAAVKYRKSIGLLDDENTNVFRLIHAEGDGLPGLIIDFYNGTAVLQAHSIGMYLNKENIVAALKINLAEKLKAVYDKSAETLPENFSRENVNAGYIFGEHTTNIVLENNNKFDVDWVNGQKTGFFIDQRENRKLLGDYSKDKKVLNTFCYSGGFSIYAINAGATLVHSVDSSKKAIDLTNKNVELLDSKTSIHESFAMDTFQFLEKSKEEYDIIILDPPAFAKHINAKHNAVQGYKRLNCEAIKMIKPGGIIFTFSCSQVVDRQLFERTIMSAAIQAGRNVRIMHHLSQPADHAPSAFHPEGEYLKGLVLFVE